MHGDRFIVVQAVSVLAWAKPSLAVIHPAATARGRSTGAFRPWL
jgi:hypothetical protein